MKCYKKKSRPNQAKCHCVHSRVLLLQVYDLQFSATAGKICLPIIIMTVGALPLQFVTCKEASVSSANKSTLFMPRQESFSYTNRNRCAFQKSFTTWRVPIHSVAQSGRRKMSLAQSYIMVMASSQGSAALVVKNWHRFTKLASLKTIFIGIFY